MSAEGQKVVEDNGYIAVEGAEAFEGTQPSGKAVVGDLLPYRLLWRNWQRHTKR